VARLLMGTITRGAVQGQGSITKGQKKMGSETSHENKKGTIGVTGCLL